MEGRAMSEQEHGTEEAEYTIDLFKLMNDLWKGILKFGWLMIVLTTATAFLSCAYAYQSFQPVYAASATFTVNLNTVSDGSMYEESMRAAQMSKTFPYIIYSGILKNIIADDLGVDYISEAITAENVESTNIFTIKVSSGSARRAYDVLQSVIKNYPRIAEAVVGSTKLTMLDETGVPAEPSNRINYRQSLKFGILPGAIAGALIIFIYALTRDTVQRVEDIEKLSNIKYLGGLPEVVFKKRRKKMNHAISLQNDKLPEAFRESISKIRTRIEKAAEERRIKTIMVTSAVPGEGKSTFALNLAISLAETGKSVILLDCDFRRPMIKYLLPAAQETVGLEEVLEKQCDLTAALKYYEELKLFAIPCLKPVDSPSEVIGSYGMFKLLKELKEIADYVIVDTAPAALLSDTSELAKLIDGVVFLIKQDFSKAYHILEGLDHLSESSDAWMIGCVLNGVKTGLLGYSYGYGYGYGHYGRYGI